MDKHSANTEDSARQVLVAQWTTLGQYRRQRTTSVSSAIDKHSEDSAWQVLVEQWTTLGQYRRRRTTNVSGAMDNTQPIQKTAYDKWR